MATNIDVITGFLESGKTTFINGIIEKNYLMEYKKTVLIVCEEGVLEYEKELLEKNRIEIIMLQDSSDLTEQLFINIKKELLPDYIIMEYNGTWDIALLFNMKIPRSFQFRNIIFVSEAQKFGNYLGNMASIMQPHIINSDIVLFNRYEGFEKKQKKKLHQDVKNINKKTEILFAGETAEVEMISDYFIPFEKYRKINKGVIIAILLLACTIVLPDYLLLKLYEFFQSISTIFLSILLEAIPFILLGAFISSIIQFIIPSGWIMKKFSQQNYSSFIMASVSGFFMPICDCGTVPIVSGLLKKGTPLPQTITFWLASSAVNPIVLISVYYAFPEQPYLILIRMVTGMVIALIIGFILKASKIKTMDVVTSHSRIQYIGSDMLELQYEGRIGKIEAVVKGAKFEFFRVAKYVIMGAFISSLLQTLMPQMMKNLISSSTSLQLIIMIAAAIFMSTCSTSNAFIGRSFLKNFTIIPVMSFIVLGPMLDFKNLLMLSGILKKRFILLLAVMVCLLGFIVFNVLAMFL